MKIGVISDIEGNDEKLHKVINELDDCDLVANLGDCVGDKGDSNAVIELLNQNKVKSILGNHDLEIILDKDIAPEKFLAPMIYESLDSFETDIKLSKANFNSLKKLNLGFRVNHNGNIYSFYHSYYGQYKGNTYFEYIDKDNAEALLKISKSDIIFIGHNHIPEMFRIKGDDINHKRIKESTTLPLETGFKYIINVGSIGAPRDKKIDYSYAVVDTIKTKVSLIVKRK